MTGPIFVVGASRCGTELVRSALNRHSLIHIASESHWFDDHRARLIAPDAPPQPAEEQGLIDYLLSVRHHGYGLRDHSAPSAEAAALREHWQSIGVRADDAFAANCRIQAQRNGKSLWGEKTPRHLFRTAEILKAFPDAKIVICLRDPRGAVASYRDWRNNWFDRSLLSAARLAEIETEEQRVRRSYSLTIATLMWRSAARSALRLCDRLPADRLFLVGFERLLAQPEPTLRSMCDWLGVGFEPMLLAASVTNSSYEVAGATSRFDETVSTRWRHRLSPDEAAYIEWLTRHEMQVLGYQPGIHPLSAGFALRQIIGLPGEMLRALRANHKRIGGVSHFLRTRLLGV
ncbi:sulfotransferase [Sphingobium sufflavum]|uniref:sulfotransferase family protein n=1 Tax=Sphingobium sufflavum TaxID=1129547 RepID=UPI001F1F9499|nr:sulfotransferase [Sphingobium sufflavum]MCE7798360.1 sulfotransferase [Sphingobium sufflavum]